MKGLAKKRAQVDLKMGPLKMKKDKDPGYWPLDQSSTGGTLQIGEPTLTEDKDLVQVDGEPRIGPAKDDHQEKKFEMMTGLLTKMDKMDQDKDKDKRQSREELSIQR